ncbi:MAG: hypothetical protein ACYTEZ_05375 [Planctomycetota bacterium]|jgi:hypothetical protein
MISHRYAWPAAALLLVAFVPTLLNVYRQPPPLEAGALAAAIPADLARFEMTGPGKHQDRPGWVEENYAARDFFERKYRGDLPELEVFAARTYDGKKLFHFPELALTYGRSATAVRTGELRVADGTVPVRRIEFRRPDSVRVAASALFYGKRSVDRPVAFLFKILPELFLGRREPMTLIYVQGEAPPAAAAVLAEEVDGLLAASAEAFLAGSPGS